MERYTTFAALLALVLFVLPASAQDAEEEPDHWNADITLSLNASGGNKDLTVFLTEAKLTRLEAKTYEASVGARFRYGHSEGEEVARDMRGTANVDLWPSAAWSPFLFATAERDLFKKLEARLNAGVGIKHAFLQQDWNELSLSSAILYSYENLEVADSLGDGVSHDARWSVRARGRLELGEGRRLEQVVFYQPVWDTFDDYQLESTTTGRFTLTQNLAFTASLLYERDSDPAPEVKPDDWTVALGFSLATGW